MILKKDSKVNRDILKRVYVAAIERKQAEQQKDGLAFAEANKRVEVLTKVYQRTNRL